MAIASSARRCLVAALGVAIAVSLHATSGEAQAGKGASLASISPEDRTRARELGELGFAALARKDYPRAKERCSDAHALVPAPTLGLCVGRALVGLEEYEEAAKAFDAVAATLLPADAPEAWREAIVQAGRERPAVPTFAWVVANRAARKHVARGFVALDRGQTPEAETAFRTSITYLDNAPARLGLGQALAAQSELPEANAELDHAEALAGNDATLAPVRAEVLRLRPTLAARSFTLAGERGRAALAAGDFASARDLCAAAAKGAADPSASLCVARAWTGLEEYEEAVSAYDAILAALLPGDAPETSRRAVADAKRERPTLSPLVATVTDPTTRKLIARGFMALERAQPEVATGHFVAALHAGPCAAAHVGLARVAGGRHDPLAGLAALDKADALARDDAKQAAVVTESARLRGVLQAQVSSIDVRVKAPSAARIAWDAEPPAPYETPFVRRVLAGDHLVRLAAPGMRPITSSVRTTPGTERIVDLALEPLPNYRRRSMLWLAGGGVALGVAAGLAVGASVVSTKLNAECDGTKCGTGAASKVSLYDGLRIGALVSAALGVGAAATSGVLWLARDDDAMPPRREVGLRLSPTGVELSGSY